MPRAGGRGGANAEGLALAVSGALTKDKFLHRAYVSPMEYRMLDAKKPAEMLVARLDEECEKPRTAKAAPANAVDSEIVMMVPARNLKAIAESGFQNRHATKTTGGCNCTKRRLVQEQSIIGMQLPCGIKMN